MKKTDKDIVQTDIERNKYILELVNSWINNADTKISISCGVSSVVIAAIAFCAEHILDVSLNNDDLLNEKIILWFNVSLIATILIFLSSILFYFLALNPSLIGQKNKKKDEQNKRLKCSIFFEDIKKYDNVDEYINSAMRATEKDFNKEILREAYFNSRICSDKIHRFKIGMWLSVIAIILAVITSVLFYFATIF